MTQNYDELRIGIAAIVSPLEIPYLQEWVDWHREIGFSDFYLVLNDWSAFDMVEFQRMFWKGCSNGWIHIMRLDGLNKQLEAYNDVLRMALSDGIVEFGGIPTCQRHIDWLAFIDVDEFIRPRGKRTVKQVLNSFADKLALVFITSQATVVKGEAPEDAFAETVSGIAVLVENADGEKCDRCWMYTTAPIYDGEGDDSEQARGCLCGRCHKVVFGA